MAIRNQHWEGIIKISDSVAYPVSIIVSVTVKL